jgi:uncharacterized repeat protein (TIGR01451 family)
LDRGRGVVRSLLAGGSPLVLLALAAPAWASSVSFLSTPALMEPSSSAPSDKDGCPPVSGSADPEEGVMQLKLVVTSAITDPVLVLTDVNDPSPTRTDRWRRDTVDDVTLDEFSVVNGEGVTGGERDLDDLDGVADGQLAAGTWYVYFNLDKTSYDQDTYDCVGASMVGDHEAYVAELRSGSTAVASARHVLAMEKTASVGQNDLEWEETYPLTLEADLDASFCMRSKYEQSSARSLDGLVAHSYFHADNLRLDAINLYFYDTDGVDPGSVEIGIPGVDVSGTTPTAIYTDTAYLTTATLPSTASSGDHWVSEFCFTVTGIGGSRFSPYFMTKNADLTGAWKTDSGYGMQDVPINPPELTITKECDTGPIVANIPNTVVETLQVCNVGLGEASSVVVVDTLPADGSVAFVSADTGGSWDATTREITWSLGTVPLGCQDLSFTLEVTPPLDATSIATNAGALADGIAPRDTSITTSAATAETCTMAVDPYQPLLTVDKTADSYVDADGDGALSPGDAVSYTIVYANAGNVPLTGVALVDDLDDLALDAVIDTSEFATWDGDTLSWALGALAPGESGSVTYTVTLLGDGAFAHGDTIVANTAELSSNEAATVSDSADVVVSAGAALTVAKAVTGFDDTDADGLLSPGDTVWYDISWSNPGSADATGVVLVDDADEAHVAALSAGSWDGDVLTWTLGTVAAGSSGSVTYGATLAAAGGFPHGDTVVDNVVALDSAELAPVTDAASVTVTAAAALGIDKRVIGYDDADSDGALSPGDTVTYAIDWWNDGNAAASALTLTDDIDEAHMASISADGAAWDGDVAAWSLGDAPAGSSGTVSYAVTLAGPGGFLHGTTTVGNVAVLDCAELDAVSDSASVSVTAAAALELDKTYVGYDDLDGSGSLSPGDTARYEVAWRNTGNAAATGVQLVDDPDEAWLSSVSDVSDGGVWDGSTITWSCGTVEPGASGTYSYATVLAGPGAFPSGLTEVPNTATLSCSEGGVLTDAANVVVAAGVSLSLVKTWSWTDTDGNGVLSPGDTVSYDLTWANGGDATAPGAVVVDDPDEVWLASVLTDGVWDGDTIAWALGDLPPGASGTLSYDVVLAEAGVFPTGETVVGNTAVLTDTNGGWIEASAEVTVAAAPILGLTKVLASSETLLTAFLNEAAASAASGASASASAGETFATGTRAVWELTLTNSGTATAEGATLEDSLPAGLAYVSATGGAAESGGVVTWSLGDVAPGASITVTVETLAD